MSIDLIWQAALHRQYPDSIPAPSKEQPAENMPADLGRITVARVLYFVAQHYGIYVAEIRSDRRSPKAVRARHVAAYLAYHLTTQSYPEIGKRFGKHHTTILGGVESIEKKLKGGDEALASEVNSIRAKLEEGVGA
jgi:chromosomal replication initiation ATPase DnaA